VEILERNASVDFMARRLRELAEEMPFRTGDVEGELADASVDELVSLLSKELRGGILSVAELGDDEARTARLALRRGRPMAEAIAEFAQSIKPLIGSKRRLRYEFHAAPAGRMELADGRSAPSETDVFEGRKILLIERNPAHAD